MKKDRQQPVRIILTVFLGLASCWNTWPKTKPTSLRFETSFPASVHKEPITGRVFVVVSRKNDPEPRSQVGFWVGVPPLFGVDVDQLKPGQGAVLDGRVLGFPVRSLEDIPADEYYVQAVLNLYTEFHRLDGHVVRAHMDQWEGQQFNRSPGNLYSEAQKVRLDPKKGYKVRLELTKVIPPVEVPPDTEWVKHVKIQSKLLSQFWGRPIYLGATVLLPKGYDAHPEVYYPVVYEQDHFSLAAPFGFSTEKPRESGEQRRAPQGQRMETGYEFYEAWNSDNFPRMIAVRFQHPTPYFDDSYAVNSANNGPYGDALMTELVPYVEEHFRIIRKPYGRVLTGGSTGGWESLALQVYHPDFFGGTWTFFPDPIDFRRYGIVNIYDDDNAFVASDSNGMKLEWARLERPLMRTSEGQAVVTIREFSRLEDVLGSKGRSAQQLEAWEAVYGPVGDDGYPKPVWDKKTGKIDHEVAKYMRDRGYDLRYYVETNWPKIGTQLVGKLHLYCGDMDNFYLNLAVYLFENFLAATHDPFYAGSFEYGRPMKGHGWAPMTRSELIKMMADQITKNTPGGEDAARWRYN